MSSLVPSASADLRPHPERLSLEAEGALFAGRYELRGELGRGGAARVYRAWDTSTAREVALKQLVAPGESKVAQIQAQLFEREFHVLAQLSHPRVIGVFDFGIERGAPYYTMELLDGGDLRDRAPLPWRTACELIFDVCSSLALLHSRGLVHRDVSPRNVRCTEDGFAKLIDFGAMATMGAGVPIVGTPPFVAPEALHGLPLDARTDLFSLGATMYFALTGRLAYPALDFTQLQEAWTESPLPPSSVRQDIPLALDHLVLSLVSLESALRPRSACEVMQRLSTIANIRREESRWASEPYLVAPLLVGRDTSTAAFRAHLELAAHGRGRALLFAAAPGLGRSRMLDACALEAKLHGACVLRAQGGADTTDFAATHALALQLLTAMPKAAPLAARAAGVFDQLFEANDSPSPPEGPGSALAVSLKSFTRLAAERGQLVRALSKWLVQLTRRRPLVIVIDDADRLDEPSIALLASLSQRARQHALLIVASGDERASLSAVAGVTALYDRCDALPLTPLALHETEQMLSSIFGDVPNLALVSERIQSVAAGNPREIMGLLQHLLDRGLIRYRDSFSLPAQLSASDLPRSADDAFRLRARSLSPLARHLAELHALAGQEALARDHYAMLAPDAASSELDGALEELLARQVAVQDGSTYSLVHRAAADLLCDDLPAARRAAHHAALADLFERTERHELAVARHLLLAGDHARSFERMIPRLQKSYDRAELSAEAGLSVKELGDLLTLALATARQQQRALREQHELRHWLTLVSVVADQTYYWHGAPEWRAQLERDSGLCDWRELTTVEDAGERRKLALTAAMKRYALTDPSQRGYSPEEAIRRLVHYVVLSIAVGSRIQDHALLSSLPELLEPFAPMSPLLSAIYSNSLATRESNCARQLERACERWAKIYEELASVGGSDPGLVRSIRFAIAYGIGINEAVMGIESAGRWAEVLDGEPLQKVNAMYLRKVVRLQQGDLEGAEWCRKQAELLALQARVPQMFTSVLVIELATHYAARDLLGVKHVAEKIAPLAARNPGWRAIERLAEGHQRRLSGDPAGARQIYEQALSLCTPDRTAPDRSITAWPMATAAYVETLLDLDLPSEAEQYAERALLECGRREIRAASHELSRVLALAEARLGKLEHAADRLEALADTQRAMGVSGVVLGATYEARTRVAIWASDHATVTRYSALTAEQYRHGRGSTLGARYQRLMNEARDAGVAVMSELSPFELSIFRGSDVSAKVAAGLQVARHMEGAEDRSTRAQRALQMLCEAHPGLGGHLFLVEQSQLRVAASRDASPPDEVLQRLVCDYWSQLTQSIDPDTEAVPERTSALGYAGQVWSDEAGQQFRPLPLCSRVGGQFVHAGVALLRASEATEVHVAGAVVVSALAQYFARSGESIVAG